MSGKRFPSYGDSGNNVWEKWQFVGQQKTNINTQGTASVVSIPLHIFLVSCCFPHLPSVEVNVSSEKLCANNWSCCLWVLGGVTKPICHCLVGIHSIVVSQDIKLVFHHTAMPDFFFKKSVSYNKLYSLWGSSLTLLSVTNLLKLICIQFNLQASLRYSSFDLGRDFFCYRVECLSATTYYCLKTSSGFSRPSWIDKGQSHS